MEKLVIDGGRPARSEPMPPAYPGGMMLGQEEAEASGAVVLDQSPFRYYGPNMRYAVQQLEDMISAYAEIPYVLGVTSGTAALVVALKALGVGYGDKVIVPANTFLATPGAVVCSQAVPVFADVDDSLNISPESIDKLCEDDEVKAIITVPILGNLCDMDAIQSIAKKWGIPVIEDIAQSCGATYKGSFAGTIGDIGTLSFQMNKVLTAGEGGAVITRDANLFERAVRYHDQGSFREKSRYGIVSDDEEKAFVGQNYRMSEVTGGVLVEQWKRLNGILGVMRARYIAIQQTLAAELPGIKFRVEPDSTGYTGSHLGMILPNAAIANQFMEYLYAENIQVYPLYGGKPVFMLPQLLHQRTADVKGSPFAYPFRKPVIYTPESCPNAVSLMPRTMYLPISPLLTEQDAVEIAAGIIKVYRSLNISEQKG